MHPPHVVSFQEFFKSPIKTGPHPKFAGNNDSKDKKKEDQKKDDKNKEKHTADPKSKKDDDWGTKKKAD